MLKWLRLRAATRSSVSSRSVPSGFMKIGAWNIRPAFSSSVMRASKPSTRSSMVATLIAGILSCRCASSGVRSGSRTLPRVRWPGRFLVRQAGDHRVELRHVLLQAREVDDDSFLRAPREHDDRLLLERRILLAVRHVRRDVHIVAGPRLDPTLLAVFEEHEHGMARDDV